MKRTTSAENKTLVLEAFDTLFNKRDYVAAERYWSPNYIQHSAHIEPGREGLFSLIKSIPLDWLAERSRCWRRNGARGHLRNMDYEPRA